MSAPKKLFVKTYGCQMNVYDSERMTAALAAEGYAATGDGGGRRPHPAQHLPHPREGGGEGLFRARAAAAAEGARPGLRIGVAGLRRAGRGGGDRGAGAGRRPGGRAAGLPPAAGAAGAARGGRAAGRDRLSRGGQVRPPGARPAGAAGAGGVPDGAGGLRQVLRLLRGALHPRRGGVAPGGAGRGGGAGAGGARGGRADAARAERQRLPRRGRGRAGGADRAAGADRGAGADPLHHLASERHGRRSDRGAWRGAEADAVPAPAGAGGQRPGAEGDEPAAPGGGLSAAGRADPGGAAGYRAVGGLHRRVSGGDRGGLSRDLGAGRGGGVRAGLFLRLLGAAGDAGGGAARACRRRRRRSGCSGCRRLLRRQQAAFLAAQVGRVLPVLVEKPGREAGQMAGRSPYLRRGAFRRAGGARSGGSSTWRSPGPGRTRWPGRWPPEGAKSRVSRAQFR